MSDDAALRRLARMAEVGVPTSLTSPGAVFLLAVAETFESYQDLFVASDLSSGSKAFGIIADRAFPSEPGRLLAVADDLDLVPAAGGAADGDVTAPVLDALHGAALRLVAALLTEPVRAEDEAQHRPLTRQEDSRLRTLAVMRTYGTLAPDAEALYASLLERDLRAIVREPDAAIVQPVTED